MLNRKIYKSMLFSISVIVMLCLSFSTANASSIFDKLTTPAPIPTEAPAMGSIDIAGLLSTPSPAATPAPLPSAVPAEEATTVPSGEEGQGAETVTGLLNALATTAPKVTDEPTPAPATTPAELSSIAGLEKLLETPTPRPTQIPHPGETYLAAGYGKMAGRGADKVSKNADDALSVVYYNVTEEDFQRFGVYLGEQGYSVAEQKMEGYTVSLWLKKAPVEFDLVYEMDSHTLTLIYPAGTDYEQPPATPTPTPTPVPTPEPTKAPTPVPTVPATANPYAPEPDDEDCPSCHGLGICSNCRGDGECKYCFGRGGEYCDHCIGGRCINCGGTGEVYRSVGLDVKKVRCSYCNGGRCRYCGGTGQIKCSYCHGTGHCSLCDGSRQCKVCNGTGKK